VKKVFSEFKEFAFKGNLIDMAVGIIIGAAFGGVVKSLVDDVIMPPLGVAMGNMDFANQFTVLKAGKTPPPYESLAAAKAAGASVLSYGAFLNTVINFLIVAVAIFALVKIVQRMKKEAPRAPDTKDCPECLTSIKIGARRCPSCTAVQPAAKEEAAKA
jgi:large conductance mechanosensitive channel